ncbi:hypothetical protein EVAR_79598_1 [Eumeta japonica]|uniref:Uncharacterized protein n=1 Tax=Eumeta variegata TaxID=151549 RepID=A0A4C1UE73_EUMVA|nr:hypothetical protein EVAR_79598_1 [Eumeta japonica]
MIYLNAYDITVDNLKSLFPSGVGAPARGPAAWAAGVARARRPLQRSAWESKRIHPGLLARLASEVLSQAASRPRGGGRRQGGGGSVRGPPLSQISCTFCGRSSFYIGHISGYGAVKVNRVIPTPNYCTSGLRASRG